jgi:UDP-N-acetylglucosamine--N-acetylmuramyl-(pentapeptide) pyrophosphoryl-undecaprenol N-acetylglucosamine transferase
MKHRPRAVLGLGGFVAGPGGIAAWLLGKPLVLHEQNAVLGFTNRLLAPLSCVRLSGFPQVFGDSRGEHVGNPVRADIVALPAPEQRYAIRQGPLHLLVLGGSQGAKALNAVLPQVLAEIPAQERPEVWHQAGKNMIEDARRAYAGLQVDARIEPFIDDMSLCLGGSGGLPFGGADRGRTRCCRRGLHPGAVSACSG